MQNIRKSITNVVSMRVMVNMAVTIAAALNFLSSLSSLIGQPSLGGLRLIFSVLSIYLLTRCDAIADSGRLGFICHPETNDIHREQCFSRYSAEMSPLMRPYLFLLVTACILVCLWTTMILYSFRHLPKIRRETFSSKREHLCHEFWKKFLFHVGSEAVVLSVILGLFCFTQKIYFAETYNCTLRNAPVKIVLTCTDLYQWDKSFLNIVLIGVMALMLLFCIGTVYQAMCNEENFIKELLTLNTTENEADDGANHHRNTQFIGSSGFTNTGNSNKQQDDGASHHRNTQFIGSSGFTNTGNPKEQQVPKTLEDLVNDPYNILGEICRCLDTTTVGLGNYEDVAKYFGFDVTVQSRFKPSPDGPSKALILSIIAVQPDVTVEAFAKVVENQARRKDVARLLREFDRKGTSSEP